MANPTWPKNGKSGSGANIPEMKKRMGAKWRKWRDGGSILRETQRLGRRLRPGFVDLLNDSLVDAMTAAYLPTHSLVGRVYHFPITPF